MKQTPGLQGCPVSGSGLEMPCSIPTLGRPAAGMRKHVHTHPSHL